MGLTSITISSSGTTPTEAELTQFLLDSVKETVDRIIESDPAKARLFTTTIPVGNSWEDYSTIWEDVPTSGDWDGYVEGLAIHNGKVISVTRENGTAGRYEACTPITPQYRDKVTDVESLFYRSAHNPVYYILFLLLEEHLIEAM